MIFPTKFGSFDSIREIESPFLVFYSEVLKNPLRMGAITPGSRHTANVMCRMVPDNAEKIVELGSGSGKITAELIRKHKISSSNLLAIEISENLCRHVRKKFPFYANAIVQSDACHLEKILKEREWKSVDGIVCTLPWFILPNKKRQSIIQQVLHILSKSPEYAHFSTIIQALWLYTPRGKHVLSELRSQFQKVEISEVVWSHFPPAVGIYCTQPI